MSPAPTVVLGAAPVTLASAEPGDLNDGDPFASDVGKMGKREMATALGP